MQTKQPCICGRAYWPAQAWQHEGCKKVEVLAKVEEITPEVANKSSYKDPEKRRMYMRDLMRKRRAAVRG